MSIDKTILNVQFFQMILLFTIITYKPPTYGSYHYPPYARAIGWVIALVSVIIPLPWFMSSAISNADGGSFIEVRINFGLSIPDEEVNSVIVGRLVP